MALNSIEVEWERFAQMVFRGIEPTDTQRKEMRKAFFAGAWMVITACEEIGEPHVSEEEGVAWFQARRAECLEFKSEVMREHGERN